MAARDNVRLSLRLLATSRLIEREVPEQLKPRRIEIATPGTAKAIGQAA